MKKQSSIILDQDKENELIEGLIKNKDLAYEALVYQYSEKMYAVARHFFYIDNDVQEYLQKTFI